MVDVNRIKDILPENIGVTCREEAEALMVYGIMGREDYLQFVSSNPTEAVITAEKIFRSGVPQEVKDRWGRVTLTLRLDLAGDYEEKKDKAHAGHQHSFAADLLKEVGKKEEAVTHHLKSAELTVDTNKAHAGHQHGFAVSLLKEVGKKEEAVTHYLKSAELTVDTNKAHAGYQHSFAASLLEEGGKREEAVTHYLKSAELVERASEETKDHGIKVKLIKHAFHQATFAGNTATDVILKEKPTGDKLTYYRLTVDDSFNNAFRLLRKLGDEGLRADEINRLSANLESWEVRIWEPTLKTMPKPKRTNKT